MEDSRDEWIKKRAYALWEEEGYPSGRDHSHWEQASKERAAMEKTAPHGIEVSPKSSRKSAIKASSSAPKASSQEPKSSSAPKSSSEAKTASAPAENKTAGKRTPRKPAPAGKSGS